MAQPVVIDMLPAELGPDGSRVYRPALEALVVQAATGALYLLAKYPRETLHVVAAALIVGTCVWLACE